MTNNVVELVVCAIIISVVLALSVKELVRYIKDKNGDNESILNILMELANDIDIQTKVLEIFNEIKMGDFNTFDDYLYYAKNKISEDMYEYIINNYPQYSSFVTIKNIKIIVNSVLSLFDKKDNTLLEEFDKNTITEIEDSIKSEDKIEEK